MTHGTTTYGERLRFFSFFLFFSAPPPDLLAGFEALPACTEALQALAEALPAEFEALPAHSKALPAPFETHPAPARANYSSFF